ncbi:MAG: alpha/beta hydrolase [Candidatus Competibacterales bacterium]
MANYLRVYSMVRRWLWSLAPAALALALGPKPEVDDQGVQAPDIDADPQALEAYLQRRETAAEVELIPDTEKHIRWADPTTKAPTELAIVYLHGFTASRQEATPLGAYLGEALNANVYYTRLAGHGVDDGGATLAAARAEDWLFDTLEALTIGERLGERVLVIGMSQGGTLATWLAAVKRPPSVLGFVLIAPNFGPEHPLADALLWPWGQVVLPGLIPRRTLEPQNPAHDRYWTLDYPSRAIIPVMAVVDLVRQLDLSRVVHPVLLIYSPRDRVVSPQLIRQHTARFQSPVRHIVEIAPSGHFNHHNIVGDILAPGQTTTIAAAIVDFVKPLVALDSPLSNPHE